MGDGEFPPEWYERFRLDRRLPVDRGAVDVARVYLSDPPFRPHLVLRGHGDGDGDGIECKITDIKRCTSLGNVLTFCVDFVALTHTDKQSLEFRTAWVAPACGPVPPVSGPGAGMYQFVRTDADEAIKKMFGIDEVAYRDRGALEAVVRSL